VTVTEARPAQLSGQVIRRTLAATAGISAIVAFVGAGVAAAIGGRVVALGIVGLALFAWTAYRPITATYVYIATLPFVAGIQRDTLIPLVRPNEAILVLLLGGAAAGGYLRFVRGDDLRLRRRPLDAPLATFVVMATIWPITSLLLRGIEPSGAELASILPICKLTGLVLLVRTTVLNEAQLRRCIQLVVVPAAALAVIAVLQTLQFGPVVAALDTYWNDPNAPALTLDDRGSGTLGHPIATGDYIAIGLTLVAAGWAKNVVGALQAMLLTSVLATGLLAAGQFSTWVGAAVCGAVLARRLPAARRALTFLVPVAPVAVAVGAPAVLGRLANFDHDTLPVSWLVRWDNVTHFYLPKLFGPDLFVGVSPNSVLPAPETWRDLIYLEAGYVQLLWIGGIPLLAAFVWLSREVLRRSRALASSPGGFGACAATLEAIWWLVVVLTVLDSHLFLRGAGDLIFILIGINTGRLVDSRAEDRAEPAIDGTEAVPRIVDVDVVRRALDVVLVTVALVLLAIPMVGIGLAVRLDSPGPALFRQRRVGIGGRQFTLLKFRTMRCGGDDRLHRDLIVREMQGDAIAVDGSYKLDHDPRVTRLGRVLRRTSFDELPQLLNILAGQMSLVGPRPCLPWEAEIFPPEFADRFAVRPGLTGLWQVSGRSRLDTPDMLRLDVTYVRERTLRRDLMIILRTVPALVRSDGAR
jgi:lipopolysaccharide/colanic/teichoic acid biosynthesis glycosyltransferase